MKFEIKYCLKCKCFLSKSTTYKRLVDCEFKKPPWLHEEIYRITFLRSKVCRVPINLNNGESRITERVVLEHPEKKYGTFSFYEQCFLPDSETAAKEYDFRLLGLKDNEATYLSGKPEPFDMTCQNCTTLNFFRMEPVRFQSEMKEGDNPFPQWLFESNFVTLEEFEE